ncbi:10160_t:CDS:2, partial [Acaulospora colombiana]
RNRLSDSPKVQENSNSVAVVKRHSLSGLPQSSSVSTKGNESKTHLSSSTNTEENESKANLATTGELPKTSTNKIPINTGQKEKKQYGNIDDIVNDLSYSMETKLSFQPDNIDDNETTKDTKKVENDPSKGSYVISAAFRSNKPASTAATKKKLESTTQESQQKSQTNTNWNSRYNEAKQKYPPVDQLDKENSTISQKNIKTDNNIDKKVQSNKDTPLPTSTKNLNDQTTPKPTNIPKPSSSTPVICAACEKPINGNVLSALGKKWHPEHFTCTHCSIVLEHVSFYEKDGLPYCHLDYHELFSPRCGSCNTPIEGQCINALGKYWHPGHFFCRECGNPFESGGFMVHDGFPYCEKDWTRLFGKISSIFT